LPSCLAALRAPQARSHTPTSYPRDLARASSFRALGINREEEKIKRSIKDAAKRGDIGSCKTYAREIVRSRKAVARLHTSKAQMNSVVMQMQNQLSQQKLMGTLSKSSDIMKAMNRLVKVRPHSLAAPFPWVFVAC
jgi:charged multivesicular body protein 3